MNKQIVLGGGCFWCLEAVFKMLPGIIDAKPGYSGGHIAKPSYSEVCTGETGHAEVVELTYESDIISSEKIFELFFKIHDPTSINRQGSDIGTQYRSIIFYSDEADKIVAEKAIKEQKKLFTKSIVTELKKLDKFWLAEEEHFNYFERNPSQGYCNFVVRPKVEKAKTYINTIGRN